MKTENYLISETAKLVGVESHVLRYWEDELKLPIRRNELGHRYYTRDDVEQFIEIKKLKEQGLQLKAIRTVLTDSKMQFVMPLRDNNEDMMTGDTEPDDKAFRLQLLLHNLVSQAVRENNEDLLGQIRESVIKELDYQFRMQEEENERRNQEHISREEEHYRELDEKLREYSGKKQKKVWGRAAKEKRDKMENAKQMKQDEKSNETMENNDETAQTIVKKRRQKSPRIWIRKKE